MEIKTTISLLLPNSEIYFEHIYRQTFEDSQYFFRTLKSYSELKTENFTKTKLTREAPKAPLANTNNIIRFLFTPMLAGHFKTPRIWKGLR